MKILQIIAVCDPGWLPLLWQIILFELKENFKAKTNYRMKLKFYRLFDWHLPYRIYRNGNHGIKYATKFGSWTLYRVLWWFMLEFACKVTSSLEILLWIHWLEPNFMSSLQQSSREWKFVLMVLVYDPSKSSGHLFRRKCFSRTYAIKLKLDKLHKGS